MPLFLLIRHGENDYVKKGRMAGRLPEVHLNKRGRAQAAMLGEKLAGAAIKAIYSSPLERALETAAPIAQNYSLEVVPRSGLLEVDIGEWQGERVKTLSRLKIWRTVQGLPSRMRFPGGETFVEAQFRICQELEALAALHDEKEILVCVTHSDPIKLAVAFYLGLPIDLFQRLHVSPASITTLHLDSHGSRLISLNQDVSFELPKN
jgi:probable phosphoglycerate mutase